MLTVVFLCKVGYMCHYTGQIAELLNTCYINNTRIKQIDLWVMNDSLHNLRWNVSSRSEILGDTCRRCNKVYFFQLHKEMQHFCKTKSKHSWMKQTWRWHRHKSGKWQVDTLTTGPFRGNARQSFTAVKLFATQVSDCNWPLVLFANIREYAVTAKWACELSKKTHFRSLMAVNIYYTRCHLMGGGHQKGENWSSHSLSKSVLCCRDAVLKMKS